MDRACLFLSTNIYQSTYIPPDCCAINCNFSLPEFILTPTVVKLTPALTCLIEAIVDARLASHTELLVPQSSNVLSLKSFEIY